MDTATQRTFFVGLFLAGIFPFFINGVVNIIISSVPLLYWGFEILIWIVVPTIVFMLAVRKGGLRFSEIGLHALVRGKRAPFLLVVLCIAFGPLDLFVYNHAIAFFQNIIPSESLFAYQSIVPSEGALRTLIAIYLGLTAGIVEEMYFRGFLFKICGLFTWPRTLYLVFSPTLFALVHWEDGVANVMATYVLGLVAAIAFILLRNLWPLIIGHIFTDYVWFEVT